MTTSVKAPDFRPVLTATITSLSGSSEGYFAKFDLTNVGKGLAILKQITLGEVIIPIRASTLSELEIYHVETANLEGTDLREGKVAHPLLEISYENINKEKFQTIYNIELEKKSGEKFNIGKFTDPDFINNQG